DDPADAANFVHNSVRDGFEHLVGEPHPVGGHAVFGVHRAHRNRVPICSLVAHDPDAAHGQQHRERLPDALVERGGANLFGIDRSFIFSGRPPTLWWDLIVAEGPRTETDSITSGYKVPCTRKSTCPMRWASSSKTSIKIAPILFRFCSGSTTLFRLSRKRLLASTPRIFSF